MANLLNLIKQLLNLLMQSLKKILTDLFSKNLNDLFKYVIFPFILYYATVHIPCEYVPNFVIQNTSLTPHCKIGQVEHHYHHHQLTTKSEISKYERKRITIDYGTHTESFCCSSCSSNDVPMIEQKLITKPEEPQELADRRNFVKEMFLGIWKNYEKNGWGYRSVAPLTNEPVGFSGSSGDTIVASMSTLWVMNFTEEFERGKEWIQYELDLGYDTVWIYYTVTQYIGGLLSCYALTGDRMFLEKASEIAHLLPSAYASLTGLPYDHVNRKNTITSGYYISLSEIGASMLEHIYLFNLTNDWAIEKRAESAWKFVRKVEKPNGLYMSQLNVETGKWTSNLSTLFGTGKDLYLNLIKSYIQSGDQNMEALKWYSDAMEAVYRNGMIKVTENNRYYVTEYDVELEWNVNRNRNLNRMSFTGCYLGAMYALGADAFNRSLTQSDTERSQVVRHMQLARELTETCHQASVNTKTGLPPWHFDLDGNENGQDSIFLLWPELAESYFILWRLTHEQKYRDYAWQMAQAIHQHCRTESGSYSVIYDVHEIPTEKMNRFPMEFLSATLKYLYLTLADDSILPLDQWVFNSAGHPLPICGANDAYPKR